MSSGCDDRTDANQAEAEYWDGRASVRISGGQIPYEADIRRATRFVSQSDQVPDEDPPLRRILNGAARKKFMDAVAHVPGGRVLDVACGPGWLALEMGRRGQTVDAYDISPGAIALARQMLQENPYREGFGQVNYFVQDVTVVNLGREKYDAVAGWSAFHHLPDLGEFLDNIAAALKPGGIVATLDDYPQRKLESTLAYVLWVLLPTRHRTYRQKLTRIAQRLLGASASAPGERSPMESHSTQEIASLFYERFEVVENFHLNAFVVTPLLAMKGPDVLRYPVARCLVGVDRLFCRLGLCHGRWRMIIARKRSGINHLG